MKCFFCSSARVRALSPIKGRMSFRCGRCNVRIIVTNPSYLMDLDIEVVYWKLVHNQELTKAKSFGLEVKKYKGEQ